MGDFYHKQANAPNQVPLTFWKVKHPPTHHCPHTLSFVLFATGHSVKCAARFHSVPRASGDFRYESISHLKNRLCKNSAVFLPKPRSPFRGFCLQNFRIQNECHLLGPLGAPQAESVTPHSRPLPCWDMNGLTSILPFVNRSSVLAHVLLYSRGSCNPHNCPRRQVQ